MKTPMNRLEVEGFIFWGSAWLWHGTHLDNVFCIHCPDPVRLLFVLPVHRNPSRKWLNAKAA